MMSDSMRSLNCFGVAGLLAENCEIFYTNDLRSRNLGRVSDLIAAQLRDLGVDELRIRSALTYGLYQVYAIRGMPNRHDESLAAASIEVGVDSVYVAVAVSFHWEKEMEPKWGGLSERILENSPSTPFEEMLCLLRDRSTQVIVRHEPKERRLEVVSLLSRLDSDLKDPPEVISIEADRSPLLAVGKYSELGDLDYADALRAEPETRFTSESEVESSTLVKGSEGEAEANWSKTFLNQLWPSSSESVEGEGGSGPSEEEDLTVVSGRFSKEQAEKTILSQKKVLDEMESIVRSEGLRAMIDSIATEIPADIDEEKAKRWVDNLSSELLQEKARLAELQRELSKQARQRELAFKSAERALKIELRQVSDQLRLKETALETKNDQITQLNLAVERAGQASNDKETKEMKVRLDRSQMIAQMKEEEAKTLLGKVRDLENRLIIAQAKAQNGNDLELKTTIQNMERKLEEYKRVNQRLMDSMNLQKDKSSDKDMADLRRKVEQTERQAVEYKRNLEKANFRIREMQESEKKLQADLARALEENRGLRKGQAA